LINPKLAKDIVNKTMAILGKNVNIMDKNGTILASGDSTRLGTYHEGAGKVIESGKPFEVYSWDVSALKGVQHGISLPIMYQDQVVGVVGITGDPDEVRKYGELVRYTAELMLEQASLREEIDLQSRARDSYFQDLLTGNWGNDSQFFYQRGHLLGLNLNIPRIVMSIDLEEIINIPLVIESEYNDALSQQRIKEELLKELKTKFKREAGFEIALVGTTSIAFFVPVNKEIPWQEQRKTLSSIAEEISSVVSRKIKVDLYFGVGEYHPDWKGLKDSYQEAMLAIHLAKTFSPEKTLFFFKDGLAEYCLTRVPSQARQRYYEQILGELIKDINPYKRELVDTLEVFFKENLNTAETAERMFIHRNTVMFRLNKIREITGLNAYQYSDAVRLQIALMFWKYEKVN